MYIRKKKNKSGSYSIVLFIGERIPGKKHPVSKMLKSFGSSTDEEELKRMWKEAELYKQQLLLSYPKPIALRINGDVDINSCRSYNIGFYDVYGSAFGKIFGNIQFKNDILQKLQELIIMRIADPCSKNKTVDVANEYGINFNNTNSIYRLMDKLDINAISKIKKAVYDHTKSLLAEHKQEVDILFYDLTTIYFETNTQDELREFGFSKDGKHQHVQIMLAAIVTKESLPIDYQEFVGNTYEGHTLIPVLNKLKEQYNIDNIVIVADAALMNKINLEELTAQNIKYIIAARVKNFTQKFKKAVLNKDDYQLISTPNQNETHADFIKAKIIPSDNNDSIIAYFSSKKARKDHHDREKSLEKIIKHLASTAKSKLTSSLRKPYVKIGKECKIEIDYAKLELESQYDGIFALKTNINKAKPIDILASYRGLWQIEQTFRIAKSNLEIRPVFHYTPRRIKAHFIICYMALALIRHVEFILKINNLHMPYDSMSLLLNKMRKVALINSQKQLFEILEDPPSELIKIYQILNIKWPKKIVYNPKL